MRRARTYYKYVYEPWSQPVPTSNSYEGFTFSASSYNTDGNCQPYTALVPSHAKGWETNGAVTGWWKMTLPYNILITNLTTNKCMGGRFYTDSNLTTPISTSFGNLTDPSTIPGIPSTGILTSCIYYTKTNSSYWDGIRNLVITATKQNIIISDETDYDYYKDEIKPCTALRKTRNYYKYVYEPWTQPTLTENGSVGTSQYAVFANSSSSGFSPYLAFNGTTSSREDAWVNEVSTGELTFYSSNPLKVSGITIKNRVDSQGYIKAFKDYSVVSSIDGITYTYITSGTNTTSTSGGVWEIEFNQPVVCKYICIRGTSYYGSNIGYAIGTMSIIATQGIPNVSTASDFDYYKDEIKSYTALRKTRNYYKYVYEPWTQPVLTSNTSDSDFVVDQSSYLRNDTAYLAWKAFDSTSNSYWHSQEGFPSWVSWSTISPLKISNITITNRYTDGAYPNSVYIQQSQNGTDWTTVTTATGTGGDSVSWSVPIADNIGVSKYWRILINSATGSNSTYAAIGQIDITATKQTTTISTSSDYDYYKDEIKAYS